MINLLFGNSYDWVFIVISDVIATFRWLNEHHI